MNRETTQDLQASLSVETRLRRKDDVAQIEFKRRCAYYSMGVIAGIVLQGALSQTDIGKMWGELYSTTIWTCGVIIVSAMGVEGITAYANMRAGKT